MRARGSSARSLAMVASLTLVPLRSSRWRFDRQPRSARHASVTFVSRRLSAQSLVNPRSCGQSGVGNVGLGKVEGPQACQPGQVGQARVGDPRLFEVEASQLAGRGQVRHPRVGDASSAEAQCVELAQALQDREVGVPHVRVAQIHFHQVPVVARFADDTSSQPLDPDDRGIRTHGRLAGAAERREGPQRQRRCSRPPASPGHAGRPLGINI